MLGVPTFPCATLKGQWEAENQGRLGAGGYSEAATDSGLSN